MSLVRQSVCIAIICLTVFFSFGRRPSQFRIPAFEAPLPLMTFVFVLDGRSSFRSAFPDRRGRCAKSALLNDSCLLDEAIGMLNDFQFLNF